MILKNTILQASGQAIARLLSFALFVYISRTLSVVKFGQFNFIYAYAAIYGILMDFGMDIMLPKLIALNPSRLNFLYHLIKFRLICIGCVLCIYVTITFVFRKFESINLYILAGIATGLYSVVSFLFCIYRGRESLGYEAFFTVIHRFLFLCLSILFLSYGLSLIGIFDALILSSAIVLACALYHTWKKYGNLLKYSHKDFENTKKKIFKNTFPFLFINLCTIIYFRVDTLMLSFIKSDYDVGIYNAAYRLMEGLIFIPGAFMTAFFPSLIKAANKGNGLFIVKIKEGFIFLSIIGLLISSILFFGSEILITVFWGDNYIKAAPVLKLLAVALLIMHFNYIITQSAIAKNKEKTYMIVVAFAVFLNIYLNIPLIKNYGAMGASFSTVITELFLGLVLFISIFKNRQFVYRKK